MLIRHEKQEHLKKQTVKQSTKNYTKNIKQHGLHKPPPNDKTTPHLVICKENEEDNQGKVLIIQL